VRDGVRHARHRPDHSRPDRDDARLRHRPLVAVLVLVLVAFDVPKRVVVR
jgi:hypothetical protein